jgi:Family of unknown function (DUF6167)
MRRGFWFVAGAGVGAYAVVRARRLAEALTADGLSDRWHALTLGARMFRDEVAQGQAEAETQLRERFGLVPHGLETQERAQLSVAQPRAVGSMVPTSSTEQRPRREPREEGTD